MATAKKIVVPTVEVPPRTRTNSATNFDQDILNQVTEHLEAGANVPALDVDGNVLTFEGKDTKEGRQKANTGALRLKRALVTRKGFIAEDIGIRTYQNADDVEAGIWRSAVYLKDIDSDESDSDDE